MHGDSALRSEHEVLCHSLFVDASELVAILLEESDLPLEKHITESDQSGHIFHVQGFLQDVNPKPVDLADLSHAHPPCLRLQLIALLAVRLELELEAQEDHAGSQHARLVFQHAGIKHH